MFQAIVIIILIGTIIYLNLDKKKNLIHLKKNKILI